MPITRGATFIAMLFAGASLASLAQAQGAPTAGGPSSSDSVTVDTIVITAKLGDRLDHAPISAVSLASTELARLDIQSVRDAQVRLPSVVYNDSGGSAQVYIRGIGTNNAYAGLESSIGTYVDGVYLQRQVGASVDVVDLRSLEVLNGPQGSLYGRNATGGVILINTNDPAPKFSGRAMGTIGNLERRDAEAVVNIPLSDQFAFRVAGRYSRLGGYTTNLANNDRLSGYDRSTVRAKLKWNGVGGLSAVLGVEHHEERDSPPARRTLLGAPECLSCAIFGTASPPADAFYQVDQTKTDNTKIRYTAGTLNINYAGDKFDLVSVTGIRKFRYSVYVDQDYAHADLFNSSAREFGTTFTSDLFVRSRLHGRVNFLLGLSGEHDTDTLGINVYGAAFSTLQGAGGDSRVKLSSISPYFEVYYDFTDALKLTVGGRYNVDRKVLDAQNNPAALVALGATATIHQTATYRDFTPRAVLSYAIPNGTLYVSYSRGAKSGGFNTPAINPLIPLRSEKLTSYEAGAKGTLLDHRLRLSGAGFYYDYTDIQVSFVDAATGSVRAENAAEARVYGLELNAALKLTQGLTISGGGLLERGRFHSYPSAAIFCPRSAPSPGYPGCPAPSGAPGLAPGVANLSDSRLPRAPDFSGFVAIDYSFPLIGQWRADAAVNNRYTSSYDFLPGAGGPLRLSRQKAYNLVSASFAVSNEQGLEVRVFGTNLAKAEYFTEVPTSAFGVAGTAAPPRTYGVSVAYSF